MNNAIYISGYLNDNEMIELRDIEKNLLNNHTSLSVRNLKGCIMHSALDFADLELILFSYELFKHFILSGSYDVLKYNVVQIWEKIHKTEKVPFTIGVEDIPIGNAHENIKVKIDGKLTKKQKETVIDRTFDMVNRLIDNDFALKEKSKFYDAFNAHLLSYDPTKETFEEIDIEKEIRKKEK